MPEMQKLRYESHRFTIGGRLDLDTTAKRVRKVPFKIHHVRKDGIHKLPRHEE